MPSRRPSYRRNLAGALRFGAVVAVSFLAGFLLQENRLPAGETALSDEAMAQVQAVPHECPHCKARVDAAPGAGILFYNPFPAIYEESCGAVVSIQGDKVEEGENAWEPGRNAKLFKGMGTGIIIDPRGYIVTNHHVVAEIRKIQVTTHDKKTYTAMLIGKDLETDLALIKITPETPLQHIKLGHSDSIRTCDYVLALGNPFGYDFTGTIGVVSHLGRDVEVDDTLVYRNAIQIDVSINPGNSGGPLLNTRGEMIGINVAIRQGADRTAFAMPVDQVVAVVAKLIGEHTGKSIYHGVGVVQTETTPVRTASAAHSSEGTDSNKPRRGLVVAHIEPGSPADHAGIKPGDAITAVNDNDVSTELEFNRSLIGLNVKEEMCVSVVHEGETDVQRLSLTLGSPNLAMAKTTEFARSRASLAPNRAESNPKIGRQADDPVWEALGFQATPLRKEDFQRRYSNYLTNYPGGVVIKAIQAESPFATAGVRVGDVLVGFHLWTVVSQKDLLFIAKEWTSLSTRGRAGRGREDIRIYLLRGNEHFYQDIPLNNAN